METNPQPQLVVDQSERVIASNVFEEKDFPHMSCGRVALLGDGELLSPEKGV